MLKFFKRKEPVQETIQETNVDYTALYNEKMSEWFEYMNNQNYGSDDNNEYENDPVWQRYKSECDELQKKSYNQIWGLETSVSASESKNNSRKLDFQYYVYSFVQRFADRPDIIFFCLASIFVAYLALKVTPLWNKGLMYLVTNIGNEILKPFPIIWCKNSPITLLIFLGVYALIAAYFISLHKNTMPGKEYGSASWASTWVLKRKYSRKGLDRIFTKGFSIAQDDRIHWRNLNTFVVGGAGSGKSFYYVGPNILQMNTSMVITDTKGDLLANYGKMLKENDYVVKCLNIVDPGKSDFYNPFKYIKNENDLQRLATNLFTNTTPQDSKTNDPFFEQMAQVLLKALMFAIWLEAPEEEKNFSTLMYMLEHAEINENNVNAKSGLDHYFDYLEAKQPNHIAVRFYKQYRGGAAKTIKSIQISLNAHLEKFTMTDIRNMTASDTMDLENTGEKKTAIFCVIPDNDISYNFLIGMLFTQLFQALYHSADNIHAKDGKRLKVPVHFLADEAANICLPPDLVRIVATCRSRSISISLIYQAIAQVKSQFEKDWETLIGNCDEFLYLGGNEQSTHEYISKKLGKMTIDNPGHSITKGSHGSSQVNDNKIGRDLLDMGEVNYALPRDEAILFISSEKPIKDKKYDPHFHPNFPLTGAADKANLWSWNSPIPLDTTSNPSMIDSSFKVRSDFSFSSADDFDPEYDAEYKEDTIIIPISSETSEESSAETDDLDKYSDKDYRMSLANPCYKCENFVPECIEGEFTPGADRDCIQQNKCKENPECKLLYNASYCVNYGGFFTQCRAVRRTVSKETSSNESVAPVSDDSTITVLDSITSDIHSPTPSAAKLGQTFVFDADEAELRRNELNQIAKDIFAKPQNDS